MQLHKAKRVILQPPTPKEITLRRLCETLPHFPRIQPPPRQHQHCEGQIDYNVGDEDYFPDGLEAVEPFGAFGEDDGDAASGLWAGEPGPGHLMGEPFGEREAVGRVGGLFVFLMVSFLLVVDAAILVHSVYCAVAVRVAPVF